MVKDHFWEMADSLPGASIPFKSSKREDNHIKQTLFDDHPVGAGVLISPCTLLHMRIEQGSALVRATIRVEDLV